MSCSAQLSRVIARYRLGQFSDLNLQREKVTGHVRTFVSPVVICANKSTSQWFTVDSIK